MQITDYPSNILCVSACPDGSYWNKKIKICSKYTGRSRPTLAIQYWPNVTHAMKRAPHVGCNACNARIQCVLHRICYSNVGHMKRASYAWHMHGIRTTFAWHPRCIRITFAQHLRDIRASITAFDTRFMTRLLRVCRRPFMYCRCLTLLARRKCAGPWVTFGQYCSPVRWQYWPRPALWFSVLHPGSAQEDLDMRELVS
jgi:hypothetical protein